MKIGMIDLGASPGHIFPNLPLMKLSAWHKRRGDEVEFYEPLSGHYDKVYASKVFDFAPDYDYPIYADEVVYGGTGYSLETVLPPEAESVYPDYSLYGVKDMAYGFLTRGCPRGCGFCVVTEKEGPVSRKVSELSGFWNGQRNIKLLDPNLLACNERETLLKQLAGSGAWIDFSQGLDIRLMTEDIAGLIMNCKIKMLHFAWDSEKDSGIVCRSLELFKRRTGIDMRKARVYVLVNYDTDFEFDLYRVYALKSLGYDPYIMIYDKQAADRKYRQLQRWVNNKFIFRSGGAERFEDYLAGVRK